MFSFPAWVAQAWRLQQSTFKEEAHCHPCHGEDQSGAQGLSGAHGQAAVVLTCTIHASWHRAQRGCRTAWCRLGVPRQRSRPQGGTRSGRGVNASTQTPARAAQRWAEAACRILKAECIGNVFSLPCTLCWMPTPRGAHWAAQRGLTGLSAPGPPAPALRWGGGRVRVILLRWF